MNTIHHLCGSTEPHSHPDTAKLQAPTPQHLALTKQAMMLSAPEAFDLIGDMLLRFPHLKQPVAALCEGGQTK